jgi:SAM-dependent MidA family methyltransferase
MCHYRHHAHGDPFLYPGLQDITAHVDFTRMARAARRAGLQPETWQTQAAWLIEEGILHELEKVHGEAGTDYRAVSAVQKLLSPAEMGELFKVLVLGRGSPENESVSTLLGL